MRDIFEVDNEVLGRGMAFLVAGLGDGEAKDCDVSLIWVLALAG